MIKLIESKDRSQLIDELDYLYDKVSKNNPDIAEDILNNNNASADDSDPNEGFMSTMSNDDLQNAIIDMKKVLGSINPETVQSMIYAVQSNPNDYTKDYASGFIDACKMIAEEFNINLNL